MVWSTGDKLHRDKYTVERELGRGRRSITYLVKDNNNHRWVIKRLNEALLNPLTPNERNRLETKFSQEAMKLSGFNHPNVVIKTPNEHQNTDSLMVGAKHSGDKLSEKPRSLYPNASPCCNIAYSIESYLFECDLV